MNNNLDDNVEHEIEHCLNIENLQSFFLFAGAGSGKTRSLVNALNFIKEQYKNRLLSQGKYIGVITYTNAACDEIIHRTDTNPMFHIATIHGFCWTIIQGFNEDIRTYLKDDLENKVKDLDRKITNARNKETQTYRDNVSKLERTRQRLLDLDSFNEFTYNPNASAQYGKDSLNHTEVINVTTYFLKNKATFQYIFITKYPFLFIDESQDTHKELIEALLDLEAKNQGKFLLGLIGDEMQRIYTQGKHGLSAAIGPHWKTPKKVMNHRSQKRIITLANDIRQNSDKMEQQARDDKQGGHAHLFIIHKDYSNATEVESKVAEQMAELTQDDLWHKKNSVKKLYLEHRMAAVQQGFIDLYDLFYSDVKYKSAIWEGTISELSFFSKLITPLMQAYSLNDQFAVMEIMRNSSTIVKGIDSPLTSTEQLSISTLSNTAKSVEKLANLFHPKKNSNFLSILKLIKEEHLFSIPPKLNDVLSDCYPFTEAGSQRQEENIWGQFLMLPYQQLDHYTRYINGESSYTTHHGVKGQEFDRVMVIMNDHAKRGRGAVSASYEKLFGVSAETDTDIQNAQEGKETDLQRTRRLFYVTCTRAKESLALVAYTESPEALKDNVLEKAWFSNDEISIL